MNDDMELIVGISTPDSLDQVMQSAQCPSVNLEERRIAHSISCGIKIVQVTQQEPTGIPNLPIGLNQLGQDLRRDPDILAKIG
jgi:hypothetical protein